MIQDMIDKPEDFAQVFVNVATKAISCKCRKMQNGARGKKHAVKVIKDVPSLDKSNLKNRSDAIVWATVALSQSL